MKKIHLYILFLLLLFSFTAFIYHQNINQEIPKNIAKSNETILNVDKVRFTFKVAGMTQRAFSSILLSQTFNDKEHIENAIEFCEAAIAFANINYTKDQKLLDFAIPKLDKVIATLDAQETKLTQQDILEIKEIFDNINRFVETREKETWANIQQNYINFITNEAQVLNLYKTIIFMGFLLLLAVAVLFILKKRSQAQSELLMQKLNYAANEALAGYWEWNLKDNSLYLSKKWKSFLGYKEEELENNFETFKTLVHPNDFHQTINLAKQYVEGKKGTYKANFRLKAKNDTYKWVSAVGALSANDDQLFFGFHIDIDDLTTTKETLLAQSKSAMMGEMVGAIAHQIKQPLSIISMISNNQLASVDLQEQITSKMIQNDANEVMKQILYLSETIDTFRNFLQPNEEKTTLCIESVIENSLNIMDKSLKNNDINIIKNFATTSTIDLYNSELMQVFINILNNAKDAFKIHNVENKVITITTSQNEKNIIIKIEDSAKGIEEEILEKIFNPYFTTKKSHDGTGLGLYIVKTIIEEHYNGSIKAQNHNLGTVFTITLPLN